MRLALLGTRHSIHKSATACFLLPMHAYGTVYRELPYTLSPIVVMKLKNRTLYLLLYPDGLLLYLLDCLSVFRRIKGPNVIVNVTRFYATLICG